MYTTDTLEETKWEHPSDYGGYSPDGEYCLYSRNRDSELLTESNWDCFIRELEKLDPEQEYFYDFRAGHWACGWVEYLMLKTDAPDALKDLATEILNALSDYPVIDESHYSEKQWDAQHDYWESISVEERVEWCKESGDSIFSARGNSIPEGVSEAFCQSEMFY